MRKVSIKASKSVSQSGNKKIVTVNTSCGNKNITSKASIKTH